MIRVPVLLLRRFPRCRAHRTPSDSPRRYSNRRSPCAFRLAPLELIKWLVQEHGFGRLDAYTLLGQVGESTVADIVDPAYTVIAKIRKRYLAPAPSAN